MRGPHNIWRLIRTGATFERTGAMKLALEAKSDREWQAFVRRYRAEMATPDNARTLDLLAALSQHASFSVGCYCADESRCHRSILRVLLAERDAAIA